MQPESDRTAARRRTAKEIFLDIVDLPRDARDTALAARAGGDEDLAADVQSLIIAHEQAEAFLCDPTLDPGALQGGPAGTADSATMFEGIGSQVGPYRLMEVLGEGGFGTVYRADQDQPVRRQVALKLIRLGMDTRQVIARFEAERQALAIMDHANIARVLDAGATETGRPFFVMELVRGVPITTWCDEHRLTPKQRLELFVPVCQAVQHAHQKGIIHRDIKPSNVLVSMTDAGPVPKVIDFGVAKATEARLTERTLFTELRQLVGTPEYMSPEQADAGSTDIDTRSDVYSLGVLLYELLTGTTPFDGRELRSKAFGEMQRVIREVEPPRPSTRLSTLREGLPGIAAMRQVEPAQLGTIVRGELDWIVMKCLEKDRTRRYQTAASLAADVLHFLADEPVSAAAPSAGYRARKFARRHRLGLGVAAVVLLSLVGGLLLASYGLLQARRERDAAVAARNEALVARAAEAAAREHEREIDRFLTGMFASVNPQQARGRPVLVKGLLDSAALRLEAEPPSHPVVEASLRTTFGETYDSLGASELARRHLERAADLYRELRGAENQLGRAKALAGLGSAYISLGDNARAEATLRESFELYERTAGPADSATIQTGAYLGEVLLRLSRYDEAQALLTDLLSRTRRTAAPEPESTITVINALAGALERQGQFNAAEGMLRDSLEQARAGGGAEDRFTIALMADLGNLLRERGAFDESQAMLVTAYETSRNVLGPDHPDSLALGNNVGLIFQTVGQLEKAEEAYLDTITRRRRIIGEEAHMTLLARSNYGILEQAMGRTEDAEATFRDVIERMRRVLGPEHQDTLFAEGNLAWLKVNTGDPATGEAMYRDLLPRVERTYGAESPPMVSMTMRLGQALSMQQRWEEAEPVLAAAYSGAQKLGFANVQGGYAASYGICLVKVGKPAQGLPLLLAAVEMVNRMPQVAPAVHQRIYGTLVEAYQALGQPEEADSWRDKLEATASSTTAPAAASATAPATTSPTR